VFERGLEAFRARDWDAAETAFRGLPADAPSAVYIERLAVFRQAPPPDGWDGVFELKTK
jgi:adenylate cyclase